MLKQVHMQACVHNVLAVHVLVPIVTFPHFSDCASVCGTASACPRVYKYVHMCLWICKNLRMHISRKVFGSVETGHGNPFSIAVISISMFIISKSVSLCYYLVLLVFA